MKFIHIFRDGIWAGTGTVNAYDEIQCDAAIPEDIYEDIESDLARGELYGKIPCDVYDEYLYTWRIDTEE